MSALFVAWIYSTKTHKVGVTQELRRMIVKQSHRLVIGSRFPINDIARNQNLLGPKLAHSVHQASET